MDFKALIDIVVEEIFKKFPVPTLFVFLSLALLLASFFIIPDFFINTSCIFEKKPNPTLITVYYKLNGNNPELEALEGFVKKKNAYIMPMPSDNLKSINTIQCTNKTEKLAKEMAVYLNKTHKSIKIKALYAIPPSKQGVYYPYHLKENTIVLNYFKDYENWDPITSDNIDRKHCVY